MGRRFRVGQQEKWKRESCSWRKCQSSQSQLGRAQSTGWLYPALCRLSSHLLHQHRKPASGWGSWCRESSRSRAQHSHNSMRTRTPGERGKLIFRRIPGPLSQNSDLVSLGWSWIISFSNKQRSGEPLAWTDEDLQGPKATEPGPWKQRACPVQAPLSWLLNRDKPQDSGSRMISITPWLFHATQTSPDNIPACHVRIPPVRPITTLQLYVPILCPIPGRLLHCPLNTFFFLPFTWAMSLPQMSLPLP